MLYHQKKFNSYKGNSRVVAKAKPHLTCCSCRFCCFMKIVSATPTSMQASCIYKLTIGSMCYIGCTEYRLTKRIKEHERAINEFISTKTYRTGNSYYANVFGYIERHPEIEEIKAEVLLSFEGIDKVKLMDIEEVYVVLATINGNCLNRAEVDMYPPIYSCSFRKSLQDRIADIIDKTPTLAAVAGLM